MNKRYGWKSTYRRNNGRKINFASNYLGKAANERYLTKAARFSGEARPIGFAQHR